MSALETRKTYYVLQAGRALAALLVVLYHNSLYIFSLDKYWGVDPAHHLFDFTHSGVEFFFVLSGFIILEVHWQDIGRPSQLLTFLRKRFVRIYPIYWLVLLFVVPVYFLIPSFGQPYHRTTVSILSSASLIYFDENAKSILAVGWTLFHEVLFYAMFAVLILNRWIGSALMCFWLLASVSFLPIFSPLFPLDYLISPLHLLFGMGMVTCWLLRYRNFAYPRLLAVLGIGLFILAGLEEDYVNALDEYVRDLYYGFGSALAVIGLIELERQGRIRVPGWLTLIGNASYSIYLTHFTLLSLMAKVFIKLGAREYLPVWGSYILLLITVVMIGVAIHWFIERPLLRFVNAWLTNRRRLSAVPQFT